MILVFSCLLITQVLSDESPVDKQESNTVHQIVEGIKKSHECLLKVPGGIGLEYEITIEQDQKDPILVWRDRVKGQLYIKWPIMRTKNEGEFLVTDAKGVSEHVPEVREGNYDFEKQVSVIREGNVLGQIGNYRHRITSSTLYPLGMLFYAESSQSYVPNEPLTTSLLLPDALEQVKFIVKRDESIGGELCKVLETKGDVLWIAPNRNFIVCKRETQDPNANATRKTENLDLRQIARDVWLPYRQVEEVYLENKLGYRLTLNITNVRVGDLTPKDVDVILGKDLRLIEDHISSKAYFNRSVYTEAFKQNYKVLRKTNYAPMVLLALSLLIIVFGMIIYKQRLGLKGN
jgi:hypothetical protein